MDADFDDDGPPRTKPLPESVYDALRESGRRAQRYMESRRRLPCSCHPDPDGLGYTVKDGYALDHRNLSGCYPDPRPHRDEHPEQRD